VSTPPRLPSPARLAINFARAAARRAEAFLHGRPADVPEVERQRRLAVCAQCPLLLATVRRCRHQDCGCWVDEKAGWATEECPEDCWRDPARLVALQERYPPVVVGGKARPVVVLPRSVAVGKRCCGG